VSPKEKKALDTFDMKLSIKLIDCSDDFPKRQRLDVEDLSRSLSKSGLIQPIIVRAKPDGRYDLICGWRRLNAAKKSGWGQIPSLIKTDVSDLGLLKLRLAENIQRKDLEVFEVVDLISELRNSMHSEHIAELVGWSRSKVDRYLQLKQLPRDILVQVADGKIYKTPKDLTVMKAEALAMAGLTDDSVRKAVEAIQEYGLTMPQLKKELEALKLRLFQQKTIETAKKQGTETLLEYAIQEVKLEKKYKPIEPAGVSVIGGSSKAEAAREYSAWAAMVTVRCHLRKLELDAKKWGLDVILRESPTHMTFILKLNRKLDQEPIEERKLKPSDAQQIKGLLHKTPDGRVLVGR
jgi:ParB/RepB/Spo0J family partition protein